MVSILAFFGIYPEAIEQADDLVQRYLEAYHLEQDTDRVFEEAWPYLQDHMVNASVTDTIIWSLFEALENEMVDKAGIDEDRISMYVNGLDSHFLVDGAEQ